MIDFEQARTTMVDSQVRPSDVTSHGVIEAFLSVPREQFVPAARRELAYIDEEIALSAAEGERFLMDAMPLSKLIQLASVKPEDFVLDVGCASGYSTAILSKLANSVVALECDEALATQASQNLTELGCDNAVVVTGALEKGLDDEGPYDVILVCGCVDNVPDALTAQLKNGGRLVVVQGEGNTGTARLYMRDGDVVGSRDMFNCAVRPLPGFQNQPGFVF